MESSTPETQYLSQSLGNCLAEALSELVLLQPQDPIEFLANYLQHYRRQHPLPKPPPLPKTLPRTLASIPISDRAAAVTKSQPQPLPSHGTEPVSAPSSSTSVAPPPCFPAPPQRTLGSVPRTSAAGEDVDPISFDYGDPGELIDPRLFVHMDLAPVLQQLGDILDDDDCFDNG